MDRRRGRERLTQISGWKCAPVKSWPRRSLSFPLTQMLVETGALDSGGRHLCELLENRLVKLREVPTLFAEHA